MTGFSQTLPWLLEGWGVKRRQKKNKYVGPISTQDTQYTHCYPEAVDMNGRFQMQGGKNWILPKDFNTNRFFWDSHWLEIWSNHFCPSMGPNGGSVAMDSGQRFFAVPHRTVQFTGRQLPPLSSVLYRIISKRRYILAAQLLFREKSGT